MSEIHFFDSFSGQGMMRNSVQSRYESDHKAFSETYRQNVHLEGHFRRPQTNVNSWFEDQRARER